MTPKARPFPANQAFTATTRQYLNRLSNVENNNDTQFAAISSRLGQLELTAAELTQDVSVLEPQVTALQGDVRGALVDLESLQQASASQAEALDLLRSQYDTARTDLDGAIQALEVLATAMDQAEAVNTAQTAAIVTLQESVTDLQLTSEITSAGLAALAGRVTSAEGRLTTAETELQSLRYADAALAPLLCDTQARLDYLIESQGQAVSDYPLPISDVVVGTTAKVVGILLLPAGDYAAPSADLGCPTTPTFTATLTLVEESDSAVLATVAGTGTMTWQTASAGFTLTTETSIELRLVGSDATAVAIIKGLRLTHAT